MKINRINLIYKFQFDSDILFKFTEFIHYLKVSMDSNEHHIIWADIRKKPSK